ncbi:unnamed protein product [Rodentolepis nana]|uniref:Methyltransf_11 domain-containing protein n=1 Tax=Rodentolepis nana TaxID=102285 RepID=A0A0R3T0R1_RODNA|nr:unnamed protein product [Rodentolepis nana]
MRVKLLWRRRPGVREHSGCVEILFYSDEEILPLRGSSFSQDAFWSTTLYFFPEIAQSLLKEINYLNASRHVCICGKWNIFSWISQYQKNGDLATLFHY